MVFSFLFELLNLFMYYFSKFVYLPIFVSYWASLRQLFWIVFQAICRSAFVPLMVSFYFDFSCFLKPCIALFTLGKVLTSSSFFLISFGRERSSPVNPTFWGSFRPFLWIHLLYFSCSLVLRFCAFSQSHKARCGAESLQFIFPGEVLWSVQCCVTSPKPAESVGC